ncbi:MAG TPA: hypothetical protein VFD29_00420 [Gillisia sp.]|nr:hypothetical protein [Gillisia sp.]
MKPEQKQWNKAELKIYILLLCAKADLVETEEELILIKSKTSTDIFDRMYEEFCKDDEDVCFEKIQDAVGRHKYSYKELSELKKEIQEVFFSDKKLLMKEQNLGRVLDNILY